MEDGPKVVRHQDMVDALLAVTGWVIPANISGARVGKLAKDFLASGIFPHDILLRFGTDDPGNGWWYYKDFWLGQRGERPNEYALRQCALKWEQPVAVQVPTREPAGFQALRQMSERQ